MINLLNRDLSGYLPSDEQIIQIEQTLFQQSSYFGVVATFAGNIVGYGALLIEYKVRGGKLGHIEDICTDSEHRLQGIGHMIVSSLKTIAKENGCYKVVLSCKPELVEFYRKNGLSVSGQSMVEFFQS